jgi:hypothetical protein
MRTYVVFGTEREPALKLLTPSQDRLFYTRTMVVEDSRKAVAVTFGAGFEWAVPAWTEALPGLRPIAEKYEGPHEMRLRAMCAALILGMPLEQLPGTRKPQLRAVEDHKEDDGYRVPLVPPAPVKPAPALATP